MSLSGDVMVIRNGRSTSQISIYNYPEHLNPFYEDEQHKRLRFWRINRSNRDNENGRRNSFSSLSFSNLRDMWAFKSFSLKKKSSTLGINKTSESPPPLRREFVLSQRPDQNGWNTFDHRLRYSNAGDNFQRNTSYRSSLQSVRTTPESRGDIGFRRNDNYRSTIQFAGSSRSQPPPPSLTASQPQRSSQSSVASSNPFETAHEDDIIEDVLIRETSGAAATSSKPTPRKKRKAPAPPIPTRSGGAPPAPTILIESSQEEPQEEKLRIDENQEIANLTAEIENFVKTTTTSDDEAHHQTKENVSTSNSRPAVAQEEGHQKDGATIEDSSSAAVTTLTRSAAVENETKSSGGAIPKKITTTTTTTTTVTTKEHTVHEAAVKGGEKPKRPEKPQRPHKALENLRIVKPQEEKKEEADVMGQVECIHVHVDSPRATPPREQTTSVSSFRTEREEPSPKEITAKTSFTLATPPASKRSAAAPLVENSSSTLEPTNVTSERTELKITEESEVDTKTKSITKPSISPKPVLLDGNERMHNFAEIHKPIRSKVQNGQFANLRRTVQTDSTVQPPTVPTESQSQSQRKSVEHTGNLPTSPDKEMENSKFTTKTTTPPDDKLKIIEAAAECSIKPSNDQVPTTERSTPIQMERNEFEGLYRPKPTSHLEWKQSTLAPLEMNVPPEKRKSVKDIIESINRSQRLLNAAANKDFVNHTHQDRRNNNTEGEMAQRSQRELNDSFDENVKIMEESQREIKRMFEQIEFMENHRATGSANGEAARERTSNLHKFHNKYDIHRPNEDEIFSRYDYRETSPNNHDWNPVPKPRRTKNQHEP